MTAGNYFCSLLCSRHSYISISIIHTENVSEGCTHWFGTERIKFVCTSRPGEQGAVVGGGRMMGREMAKVDF
jgi:hypothetical protein